MAWPDRARSASLINQERRGMWKCDDYLWFLKAWNRRHLPESPCRRTGRSLSSKELFAEVFASCSLRRFSEGVFFMLLSIIWISVKYVKTFIFSFQKNLSCFPGFRVIFQAWAIFLQTRLQPWKNPGEKQTPHQKNASGKIFRLPVPAPVFLLRNPLNRIGKNSLRLRQPRRVCYIMDTDFFRPIWAGGCFSKAEGGKLKAERENNKADRFSASGRSASGCHCPLPAVGIFHEKAN